MQFGTVVADTCKGVSAGFILTQLYLTSIKEI